jgi:protein SCO1/2
VSERRTLLRNPWLWAFFAGAILLTAIRPLLRHVPEPPPLLGAVPAFSLVDQDGRAFGSSELAGQVYVVSFFFTRCPSICPLLMHAVRRLQDEYDDRRVKGIHLVSISVDPEYDTPQRLAEYARQIGARAERWTLLTGDRDAIRTLAEDGFKVPVGTPESTGSPGMMDIAHTGRLVLVDAEGRIRGYYETTDLGLEEVFHRSRRILP